MSYEYLIIISVLFYVIALGEFCKLSTGLHDLRPWNTNNPISKPISSSPIPCSINLSLVCTLIRCCRIIVCSLLILWQVEIPTSHHVEVPIVMWQSLVFYLITNLFFFYNLCNGQIYLECIIYCIYLPMYNNGLPKMEQMCFVQFGFKFRG